MVAKVESGTSKRGVLYYNENKVRNAEARLLMASGFGLDTAVLTFRAKLERFSKLTAQNERVKKNATYISLTQDRLDEDTLKIIVIEYMDRVGFGRRPLLVRFQGFPTVSQTASWDLHLFFLVSLHCRLQFQFS